jgi:glycine hydroxymethyltransferase
MIYEHLITGGINMSKIMPLIKEHEQSRRLGLNLVASENFLSNKVKSALSSDLAGRYHSYWYGGTKHAAKIIEETENLAKKLFRSKYAIVTSLAGNMCDLAVLFAFSKPGDKVAMMTLDAGGYPLGVSKFQRKLLQLPADSYTYQIKLDEAKDMIITNKPKLSILGPSFIAFPHPVNELSETMKDLGTFVFDGSHVLGFLACGKFQDPLREGADVLIGSTHKSLYGPQGGVVLTNSRSCYEDLDKMLGFDVDEGIALVDNPHVNRIAALGLALEEISEDQDYADRVVGNVKALAFALDDLGVPVKFKERGYSESHQLFLDMKFEEAQALCLRLEQHGIFIDIAGRMGVAEITHKGMKPEDMDFIAHAISDVFFDRVKDDLKSKIREFTRKISELKE